MRRPSNETGAVLLTTLLLMALMAAITIAIVDDIRFSIRRTISVQSAEQLAWFERGGEDFAKVWLKNVHSDTQSELGEFIRADNPVIFPIDQGVLNIRIQDARNCYNVNQLANPKTKKASRQQFSQFLQLLEFDVTDAEILAASIQDWVDADTIPNSGGAEGLSYANLTPAYHAADTLMVDISELRAVQGIDENIYQRLLPFVCVGTDTKQNRMNVNTLSLEQAPLLALLFGTQDGLNTAQTVIAERPLAGYDNVEQIWSLPVVVDLDQKGVGKDMTDTRTDRVKLDIYIQYQDQSRARQVVFNLGSTGVKLVSRRSLY